MFRCALFSLPQQPVDIDGARLPAADHPSPASPQLASRFRQTKAQDAKQADRNRSWVPNR